MKRATKLNLNSLATGMNHTSYIIKTKQNKRTRQRKGKKKVRILISNKVFRGAVFRRHKIPL